MKGYLKLSLLLTTTFLSGAVACNGDRVEVESDEKALDAVLGISDSNPRLCGLTGLSDSEKAPFLAKKNSFLKDQAGQDTDKFIDSSSKSLKEFVAETLVAIPKTLLVQVFNNNTQGQIVVSNGEVVANCPKDIDSDGPVYGCGIKKPGEPLKIYLREKKSVIGLKLVQIFAHAMSQNINSARTGLSLVEDNSEIAAQFQREVGVFFQLRENLLRAFEADIAEFNNKTTTAFRQLSHEDKLHYVFSQTADSVYCSTDSMSKFMQMSNAGQFKNTYETFFGLNSKDSRSLHSIIGLPWYKSLNK